MPPYYYTGLRLGNPVNCILAIADVHGNFKTETHFSSSWFGPHIKSPCEFSLLFKHHNI